MEPTTTSHETFERIKNEHAALREKIHRIHNALADWETAAGKINDLLHEFRHALAVHFLNEEVEGFFDDVTSRTPRLEHRVDALCIEHQRLLNEADELCRLSEAAIQSMSKAELNARWHEFSKRLMHHESQENALLQETNLDEIGTSD